MGETFPSLMATCRPGKQGPTPHVAWPLRGLGHSKVQPFPQHSAQCSPARLPWAPVCGHCSLQFLPSFLKRWLLIFLILNFKPANFSHICKANKDYPPVPSQPSQGPKTRTDQTFLLPFSQAGDEKPPFPETGLSSSEKN